MSQKPYQADHLWVGATYVRLPPNIAKQADVRGTVRLPQTTKVDILEVLCVQCRRPYDDVAGLECVAATADGREHLLGGTPGERKKRSHPYHDCSATGCHLGGSARQIASGS